LIFVMNKSENPRCFSKNAECSLKHAGLCVDRRQRIINLAENSKESAVTGYLTTHVLDTARGCPAEGLQIDLYRIEGEARTHLKTLTTNDDGRTDEQILPASEFQIGVYELVFHAGAYLDATGTPPEAPRFLDVIPLRFGMSEPSHYHVPLLLSPFGYSPYRGS
jgi:5-hydroxyisourate hydrolase